MTPQIKIDGISSTNLKWWTDEFYYFKGGLNFPRFVFKFVFHLKKVFLSLGINLEY